MMPGEGKDQFLYSDKSYTTLSINYTIHRLRMEISVRGR